MAIRLSAKDAASLGIEPAKRKRRGKPKPPPDHSLFNATCVAHGLPVPFHEYPFDEERGWRLDHLFVRGDRRVAMEVEGGIYGMGAPCVTCGRRRAGAHSSGNNIKRDMEKYREANIAGILVIRVTPDEVESGEAFALVKRALASAAR